jgi:hypothetical protein
MKLNKVELDLSNLKLKLEIELKKFNSKHKSKTESVKFQPKVIMNLLLNFESYDQTTKKKDVYMPHEKIVHFNIGFIKVNFIGKLRITQDRNDELPVDINNPPYKSYGVVEEKGNLISYIYSSLYFSYVFHMFFLCFFYNFILYRFHHKIR